MRDCRYCGSSEGEHLDACPFSVRIGGAIMLGDMADWKKGYEMALRNKRYPVGSNSTIRLGWTRGDSRMDNATMAEGDRW